MSQKGDRILYMEGGDLYRYDLKRKKHEKIGEGVESFFNSGDGTNIIWVVPGEGYALYRKLGDREKELLSYEAEPLGVSDDYRTVLYLRGNVLFKTDKNGEEEKMQSGARLIDDSHLYPRRETYYFAEENKGEISLYYTDCDQVYRVMENVSEEKIFSYPRWPNFKSKVVPLFPFLKYEEDGDISCYAAREEQALALGLETGMAADPWAMNIGIKDEEVYCRSDQGGLYVFKIFKEKLARSKIADTEPDRLYSWLYKDYYYEEEDSDPYNGNLFTLYKGNEIIADRLLRAYVRIAEGGIYLLGQYKLKYRDYGGYTYDNIKCGTLYFYDGAEMQKIAKDVMKYETIRGRGVIYLKGYGYDEEKESGALCINRGGKAEVLIADNVSYFMRVDIPTTVYYSP